MSIDKVGGGLAKRFDKLLTTADADKDGKLSRTELASAKKPNDKAVFSEAKLDKIFTRLDKDQDGLLTSQEFSVRGKGHGKAHKHEGHHYGHDKKPPVADISGDAPVAPTTPKTFFDRLLAKLDLNSDGNITADEIQTVKAQFEAQKAAAEEALVKEAEPEAAPPVASTDTVTTA